MRRKTLPDLKRALQNSEYQKQLLEEFEKFYYHYVSYNQAVSAKYQIDAEEF